MQYLNLLLSQKDNIIFKHVNMTISDTAGKILDISDAYLKFTGYKREDIIGKNHKIFRNYDLDKKIIKHLWDTLTQDKEWIGELKNNKASGEEYWVKASITPLFDENNIKTGYLSILTDITDKKQLEYLAIEDPLTQLYNRRYFDSYFKKELNRSNWKKESFALLLLGVDFYAEYKDTYGRVLADKAIIEISNSLKNTLSSKTHKLFKVTESEFAVIVINCDDNYIQDLSHSLLKSVESLKLENSHSKISEHFTISIGGININTKDNFLYSNDLYNITDTNLKHAKQNGHNNAVIELHAQQLEELQHLDLVTKLPNRTVLVHDLSLIDEESMLILLHIKQINSIKNLYGYEFTTNIITKKAKQLESIILDDDVTLYSLNLEEFAVLITNKKLFEKYLLLLEHSILINNDHFIHHLDKHISANFTAGIAYGVHNLFSHADSVLQEAIVSKSNYKIFQNNQTAIQLQEDSLKRLRVYKNALHEDRIIPYFQPIIDNNTSQVVKFEALARIKTEDGEIISPYYFLDSAKEDQSFEFFTRQMMQKVFNIYASSNIAISINVSYENIASKTMIAYIKNRLEKCGGEDITFEIVESEDILDYKILENFINMIKEYGCKVSIDDFGSGYSNFINILQLNIDYIKLDGSLVQKLNSDKNTENMIKGLLFYARNANIKTIAEFVSSEELAYKVKELGIDYSQGFYYGEPRSPEDYGLIN